MSLQTILTEKNKFLDNAVGQLIKDFDNISPDIINRLKALLRTGDFTYEAVLAIFTEAGYEQRLAMFADEFITAMDFSRQVALEIGSNYVVPAEILGKFQEQSIGRMLNTRDVIARNLVDSALMWEAEGMSLKQVVASMTDELGSMSRRLGAEAYTGISMFERKVKSENIKKRVLKDLLMSDRLMAKQEMNVKQYYN